MYFPAHLPISPGLPLASSGLPGREWDEAKDTLWGGPLLGGGLGALGHSTPGLQAPRLGAARAQPAPGAQAQGGRADETRGLALHSPCPVLQAACAGACSRY